MMGIINMVVLVLTLISMLIIVVVDLDNITELLIVQIILHGQS